MANRHTKRCSALLIVREVQIKTTMRYQLTPVRMTIIKKSTNHKCWWGCGEKGNLCTVGENVNWCSHCGKWYGGFSKKLKIELPYDPAIPLLGIYLEKMKTLIWKDTCTSKFIAVLFTIAKIWKQPICPLTDEWIKKMWYIYIQWNITQP